MGLIIKHIPLCFYISFRSDNDKLKMQLKKKDDDLMNARAAIERFTNAVSLIFQLNLIQQKKRFMSD